MKAKYVKFRSIKYKEKEKDKNDSLSDRVLREIEGKEDNPFLFEVETDEFTVSEYIDVNRIVSFHEFIDNRKRTLVETDSYMSMELDHPIETVLKMIQDA
ncbi:hypothetical protein AWW68_19455 [Roseivirga spongicola]|uniref:Uncharacterized protein n=1 Tax=Roseivirga spongicola TaxID=333140 RepID=A0A150XCH1_9BACT|nr:hypothetical protein [Roseivirga spongicola]KYG76425.1 hypothetical protein AWW68_19455 [Roseivirga spongicola]